MAMSYGCPLLLNEADCGIRQPLDLEDNSLTCPGFDSLERRQDGIYRPVTLGSFNRYRAQLHMIAASIIRDVYVRRDRTPEDLVKSISYYHSRLLNLERSIPPELKLTSHVGRATSFTESLVLRTFACQAFTLQVSYDNVQLFLFRPFIALNRPSTSPTLSREDRPQCYPEEDLISTAQSQSWTSAMRTSRIGQHVEILKFLAFKPAPVHLAAHSFAAGVMLGLLALSNPVSERGQDCRHGIARLIQLPRLAGFNAPIWSQMTEILTDLMHVIASEQTKALISFPSHSESLDGSQERGAEFGKPL